jgi:hypothetical protein
LQRLPVEFPISVRRFVMRQLLACMAFGLFLGADAPKDDVKKDKDKLQGTWKAGARANMLFKDLELDFSELEKEVVVQGKTVELRPIRARLRDWASGHECENAEPLAIDLQTKQTYVLVRKAAHKRLEAPLALDDYDPDEGAAYVNEVMAEDAANDPLLDSYQKCGKSPCD